MSTRFETETGELLGWRFYGGTDRGPCLELGTERHGRDLREGRLGDWFVSERGETLSLLQLTELPFTFDEYPGTFELGSGEMLDFYDDPEEEDAR